MSGRGKTNPASTPFFPLQSCEGRGSIALSLLNKLNQSAMTLSSLFNWIVKSLSDYQAPPKPPLPAQDPMDWRPSKTATRWDTFLHACPQCHDLITHQEYMSATCYSCGFKALWPIRFNSQSHRQIWDGEKWVWQYKRGNSEENFFISPKRLHS